MNKINELSFVVIIIIIIINKLSGHNPIYNVCNYTNIYVYTVLVILELFLFNLIKSN